VQASAPAKAATETREKPSGGGCSCLWIILLLCVGLTVIGVLIVPPSGDILSQMPVEAQHWLEGWLMFIILILF
jgi:hypothetical protein